MLFQFFFISITEVCWVHAARGQFTDLTVHSDVINNFAFMPGDTTLAHCWKIDQRYLAHLMP